jgi:hypothetical protein
MNTNISLRLFVGAISVALPALASAQSDDCLAPTPITGPGAFAYDTSTSTASGWDFGGAPCETTMNEDVFWVWTNGTATDIVFSTCTASYDTQLQVALGTDCTAVCVANNDDACALQSSITLNGLNPGDQYVIHVGSFTAGVIGPGVLDIAVPAPPPPPPTNDTCATPDPIVGEGTFPFDNTGALTSGFNGGEFASNGIHPCFPHDTQTGLEQQIASDVFFIWTAPCSGNFQIDTIGSSGGVSDTKINIHTGADCAATCYQGDDDDAGALESLVSMTGIVAGTQYLIQVGGFNATTTMGAGVLNISSFGSCPTSGTNIVCDPALPHFLGGIATLASSSLGATTGSGLHLECTGGPADEFGFFMVASSANATTQIFNGVLCLDLPAGRYNPNVAVNQGNPELNSLGQFDASGVLQSIVGTAPSTGGSGFDVPAELPFSPAGSLISAGDTYYFQCWYRDQAAPLPNPGSTANFSNVLEVLF